MVLQVLQRDDAHDDEQCAAEHFAAALDPGRDGPADQHDQAGAHGEEQRVAERELRGDRDRARAARPAAARRNGIHRQRRNRHQVIGTEAVQEAKKERGREQNHARRL
jgi:hypothetical protein